tara:strand:- start:1299 stop:3707 length:2409 start_codon:yes stop_codon:yes gene_type:complete
MMQKNIESVSPRIAQRGTTVDVRIRGLSLDDPREVIFLNPGIRAVNLKLNPEPFTPIGGAHGRRIVQEVTCQFEISEDCPVGEHAFRLLTGTELTHLATFHVGPFPIIDEKEGGRTHSNDTIETAIPIDLNVSVRGFVDHGSANDRDVYRVVVTKGQRLSVELDSVRIADPHYGDSEFDLMVRVLDSRGKVIARNDDNDFGLQDPVLSTRIDFDGDAFVEVKRSIFAPSYSAYCLHVGDFPRPTIAFPPGGQVGEPIEVTLYGDGLGPLNQTLKVPEKAGEFGANVGAPSPVRLRASAFPNVIEATGQQTTRVSKLPAALNGRLSTVGEYDDFRVSVQEGERYRVRVYAFSLGSSLDTTIQIRELGDGDTVLEPLIEHDDSKIPERDIFGTSYRGGTGVGDIIDPSFVWEPKKSGDHILRVLDTSNREGEMGIYRVEIEPMPTLLVTNLASRTFDWTESMRVSGFAVPRGNRWTVNVFLPKGQFDRPEIPFRLVAKGLPPGVEMISPPVTTKYNDVWPVQLVASSDAEIQGSVFSFEAQTLDDPAKPIATLNQQHVPFINHSGGNAWRRVTTDRYFAAVTRDAPFSIEVEESDIQLVRQATRGIPVKVIRHGDFEGPVLVSVGFVHGSIDSSPAFEIPAGESEAEVLLTARSYAPLETLPLVFIGSTINNAVDPFLGAGHIRVSSEMMNLTVTQPYLKLTAEPQSIRRGGEGTLVWNVSQQTPFEGSATLTLLGLPKGVSVTEAPRIQSDSTEAVFQLKASPEALLGNNTGIECEVSIEVDGASVVQRTGKASLRIDPALEN